MFLVWCLLVDYLLSVIKATLSAAGRVAKNEGSCVKVQKMAATVAAWAAQ